MQKRQWKRRNYFIKKDLQGRFVLRFFLTIVIGAIIFTSIFSIFSAHTITITYEDSYLKLDKTPKALFSEIIRAYGVYIFLLGIIVSILSIFISHRIAGPFYRFERSVEEITKGNLSFKITLRTKDEGKELADIFNKMIETLAGHIKDIRHHADIVNNQIISLSNRVNDQNLNTSEISEDISKTVDSVKNLKESLSFFRIDKG